MSPFPDKITKYLEFLAKEACKRRNYTGEYPTGLMDSLAYALGLEYAEYIKAAEECELPS
jgi:hypothetical protein